MMKSLTEGSFVIGFKDTNSAPVHRTLTTKLGLDWRLAKGMDIFGRFSKP